MVVRCANLWGMQGGSFWARFWGVGRVRVRVARGKDNDSVRSECSVFLVLKRSFQWIQNFRARQSLVLWVCEKHGVSKTDYGTVLQKVPSQETFAFRIRYRQTRERDQG